MMYPTFLDFEASSLSQESYPIEVAWNDKNGQIFSYLIRPFELWCDWSKESENIHGITQEILHDDGLSVNAVCDELEKAIGDGVMYSDAVDFEHHWMQKLFEAGGRESYPFEIRSIAQIPRLNALLQRQGDFEDLRRRAQSAIGVTHRASADVEALMHVYNFA